MAPLTNEIPEGINIDEERWLKIFSLKSLIASLIAFAFSLLIYKFLSLYGLGVIGIIFGLMLVAATYCAFTLKLPSDMVYSGGGLTIFQVLVRIFTRKKDQVIYVKNYTPYEEAKENELV